MDKWHKFYAKLLNLLEIHYFYVEGEFTRLLSWALTSPCVPIRTLINEGRGEKGQIVAYLNKYKGEGIHHIAALFQPLYDAANTIYENGV